ncbi:MAG: signal peptidase I [Candidatus Aenigmarchaeota archaeon]|nr:signal peptidase I [Candidatus Aenigmarchaeota archaeon]
MFPILRFKVQDKSMEPTFKAGDYVLVNKMAYRFAKPSRGDVVVIKHPIERDMFLLKRISVITNSDKFYVVGDNRDFSKDSRHFGAIEKDLIVGKVWFSVKK